MRNHTRIIGLVGVGIALAISLTSCGNSSHAQGLTQGGGATLAGWPKTLDNTKIATIYNTANDSPTIVNCASPAAVPSLGLAYTGIDGIGNTTGGPQASELASCAFTGPRGSIGVTVGPVGVSTWTDPAQLDPTKLHEATVIPGAGTLGLPYNSPDGWRWQISYGYDGSYTPADAMQMAHAVADHLAH